MKRKVKKQEREVKKVVKLIDERINTPFPATKSFRFADEVTLIEDNSSSSSESGQDFSDTNFSSARTAPTLKPTTNQQQSIEQQVANVPTPRKIKDPSTGNYESVATTAYNMPDYAGSRVYDSENKMQDSRTLVKPLGFDSLTPHATSHPIRTPDMYPEDDQRRTNIPDKRYIEDIRESDKTRRTTFRRDREKVF